MRPAPDRAPAVAKREGPPVSGFLITLFGLLFSVVGLAFGVTQQSNIASLPARATGTVVDYALSINSRGWHPVVRFTTAAGEPVRFTSNLGGHPPPYGIGQQVTVAYDPANPQHAAIDSFGAVWLIPLVIAGVGLLFFLLGLGIITGRLKRIDRVR